MFVNEELLLQSMQLHNPHLHRLQLEPENLALTIPRIRMLVSDSKFIILVPANLKWIKVLEILSLNGFKQESYGTS